jgi:Na+-transporting methylmalonyl-CoA/oxaloacetate decarboxylase gamma subunit
MTTYTAAVNNPNNAIDVFKRLGTAEQLALLWFVYKQMGHLVTPAAPGAASPDIAAGLYEQVKGVQQQQQLDVMRAIAQGEQSSQVSREYGSLSANTKLAFWFYLAKGMDNGEIIPMPDNYKLTQQGQDLLAAIESMDFEEQITVLRSAADSMGSAPARGAKI